MLTDVVETLSLRDQKSFSQCKKRTLLGSRPQERPFAFIGSLSHRDMSKEMTPGWAPLGSVLTGHAWGKIVSSYSQISPVDRPVTTETDDR